MTRARGALGSVLALVGLALVGRAAVAAPALAGDTPSLVLDPAPAGDSALVARRANVRGHWLAAARLSFDYAKAPFVLERDSGEKDVVVGHLAIVHAQASLAILHRFAVELALPLAYQGEPNVAALGLADDLAKVGLGDIRLGGRVVLARSPEDAPVRTSLAFDSSLWLPTATAELAGDGVARVGIGVGAEAVGPRLFGALHLGAHSRGVARLSSRLDENGNPEGAASRGGDAHPRTRVGPSLAASAGAGCFVDRARRFEVGSEAVASFVLGGGARALDPRATTAHLFITGRHRLGAIPIELAAALGAGLADGAGNADVRALASLGWAPDEPPPAPDRDRDGIADVRDSCPAITGTKSRDPLLNGCPEMADLDGDAVPDEHDACPEKAGTATFSRHSHGCPAVIGAEREAAAQGTRLEGSAIVISQRIEFEVGTSNLRTSSHAVLFEIHAVLAAHPELESVLVAGHTDETGSAEVNQRLSLGRAASVVDWLVRHGIAKERLAPRGYGASMPIADNETEEGRTKNRRVELHVIRPAASDLAPPAKSGGPS